MLFRRLVMSMLAIGIAGGAAAAVSNNGFEKGNLTSFSVGADSEVRVVGAYAGYLAAEGQYFAHLSNVGVEDLTPFGGTIGSYMSKTVNLAAGQGFSFKWAYQTNESGPAAYNDFAMFLNGSAIRLADSASSGLTGQSGWRTFNWLNTTAFSGTVTWLVSNEKDELSSSHLLIDDVRQSLVPAIPEPETYCMLLAGLGLLGLVGRRKNRC